MRNNNWHKYHYSLLAFVLSLLFVTQLSHAAFVLNGTRFIFNGDKKAITVEVDNQGPTTYGGQVWIDSQGGDDAANVNFMPAPTFFTVDGGKKQVIRILGLNLAELPQDRESLFWINVQEIPPAPTGEGNKLAVAINTRVKLIYRPASLIAGRVDAEKTLQLKKSSGYLMLKNPTPYYLAISSVQLNGKKIELKKEDDRNIATLKPMSEVTIKTPLDSSGELILNAINDQGGIQPYPAKVVL
ncbi:fimbrial chaperone [Yersinia kristensenii]|uniref:fimbrial chaperone n=1 Tax=Yersinia kristensenii TaxID=28152 RepID=UPI001FEBFDB8|nr:fimbrial chaperone [Yersinia kristensenii]